MTTIQGVGSVRVSSHEVKQIFKQPIEEKMTREDVANWANERIILNDDGNLEYVPNQDVKKIWASLVYFSGVDLKESPNKYLHIKEDFVNVFKKIWD